MRIAFLSLGLCLSLIIGSTTVLALKKAAEWQEAKIGQGCWPTPDKNRGG